MKSQEIRKKELSITWLEVSFSFFQSGKLKRISDLSSKKDTLTLTKKIDFGDLMEIVSFPE